MAEIKAKVQSIAEAHNNAKKSADLAVAAAAEAKKAVDQQPSVIKQFEEAATAARAELAKSYALSVESPARVPALEKAVADSVAAATAARQVADRLATEAANLEQEQKQLVAQYQKAKQG